MLSQIEQLLWKLPGDFSEKILFKKIWPWRLKRKAWQRKWTRILQKHTERDNKIPSSLKIGTTSVCNSKCQFCPNGSIPFKKEFISVERFKKIVHAFATAGGKEIHLTPMIGEALLDKRFIQLNHILNQYPSLCKSREIYTTLQWLHLHPIEEFLKCGLTDVRVSTQLCGKENYKEFFGVDLYDQMFSNLNLLIDENKRLGFPLKIWVELKPSTLSISELKSHPDFLFIQSKMEEDLLKRYKFQGNFSDDWSGLVQLPEHVPKRPFLKRENHPCKWLEKSLMVFPNGQWGACACRDPMAHPDLQLGHVDSESLLEVWNGDRRKNMIHQWRSENKIPQPCQECTAYQY